MHDLGVKGTLSISANRAICDEWLWTWPMLSVYLWVQSESLIINCAVFVGGGIYSIWQSGEHFDLTLFLSNSTSYHYGSCNSHTRQHLILTAQLIATIFIIPVHIYVHNVATDNELSLYLPEGLRTIHTSCIIKPTHQQYTVCNEGHSVRHLAESCATARSDVGTALQCKYLRNVCPSQVRPVHSCPSSNVSLQESKRQCSSGKKQTSRTSHA